MHGLHHLQASGIRSEIFFSAASWSSLMPYRRKARNINAYFQLGTALKKKLNEENRAPPLQFRSTRRILAPKWTDEQIICCNQGLPCSRIILLSKVTVPRDLSLVPECPEQKKVTNNWSLKLGYKCCLITIISRWMWLKSKTNLKSVKMAHALHACWDTVESWIEDPGHC